MDIQKVAKELGTSLKRFLKQFNRLDREVIAEIYLRGNGIEVGALHSPIVVPKSAKVKYVDIASTEDLRKKYHDIGHREIVKVDIVDNGEELSQIPDASQDFVIANGFIEHCQNPLKTIQTFMRVLKHQGILYLAIPDKRYTFDIERPVTPFEHVERDFREGPDWANHEHLKEYLKFVEKRDNEYIGKMTHPGANVKVWDIHWHVWTQREMFEFLVPYREQFGYEIELFLRRETECVFILQKTSSSR